MKKLILFLMITVGLLSGCSEETPKGNETIKDIEMPQLPDLDFTNLDFFDDGYELVELEACTDGDTAVFLVDGDATPTRFLAIDTPETNNGVDPWGPAAKVYTCEALTKAKVIVLENDDESDVWDNYDRLLAWIWVDGELLQYKLVEESLAWVKYLYGDYKYNPTMIGLEGSIQKNDLKIWGEDDPQYKYVSETIDTTIAGLQDVSYYDKVIVSGIVTGVVGNNAFIQDGEHAVYVYTNNRPFSAFIAGPGTEVRVQATLTSYNGLNELSDVEIGNVEILSENNPVPEAKIVTLSELGEEHEARLIKVTDVSIISIDEDSDSKGYDVNIEQNGTAGVIRVDKYLNPFIEISSFTTGSTIDITGNVGQYQDEYHIMIRLSTDIELK